jgi:hypothetical protein
LLETPEYLKLEKAVRRAGMESNDIIGPVYDVAQAEALMCCYRSTDAPHFRMSEPPGVSETRYKVDLSTAPTIPREEFERWLTAWSST